HALTVWCAGYFGVGKSAIDLKKGNRMYVQAAAGPTPAVQEGQDVPCEVVYCDRVITAESPIILQDASITVFANDPCAQAGFSFYAGVPLRTSRGIVVGTICIFDREPHTVHSEDLGILELLATHVARLIDVVAGHGSAGPFAFVVPDVMTRDLFR